ncbi:hypothetical protein LTR62_007210 [Meristemomyces frigidus]|uniref:SWIRM domain-containing protein n=1 Tax=Meristemomyces frigidus TaxID=1508187 RepID=A0AAN7TJ36_9PEZI|nr:hypothetical protein LTR62_007210 [Meristemomyces frigidus]
MTSETSALYDQTTHGMETNTTGRAIIGAGKLHTPQEYLHHSFPEDKSSSSSKAAPSLPHSPPTSPLYRLSAPHTGVSDEPLFPETDQESTQQPLFERQETQSSETSSSPAAVVPATRSFRPKTLVVPGTEIEIENSKAAFNSLISHLWASNMAVRTAQRDAGLLPVPIPSRVAIERDDTTSKALQRMTLASDLARPPPTRLQPTRERTVKRRRESSLPPSRPQSLSEASAVSPTPEPTPKRAKTVQSRRSRTPKSQSQTEFLDNAFPGDKKHKRSAPSKRVPAKEEDDKWRDLVDYCPPATDAQYNALTASWAAGQRLDIDDQADVQELHGGEYELCRILRLKPVQYLATKRRFFVAKVQSLKDGKSFTKTAGQNSTNIDVNKASQLWMAFDRVGWFDRKHFKQIEGVPALGKDHEALEAHAP